MGNVEGHFFTGIDRVAYSLKDMPQLGLIAT